MLDFAVEDGDEIRLSADAFVSSEDENALLGYLANNVGDHATAVVANVLAAPDDVPHFERAVHYNRLSADSLKELEALSRQLQQKTLEQINALTTYLRSLEPDAPDNPDWREPLG